MYLCTNQNCISCAKSFVANLSGRPLSDAQILLLSKGLSFIPTPFDSNHFELLKDFDCFCEKIRPLSKIKSTNCQNNNNNRKFPRRKIQRRKPKRHFISFTDIEGVFEAIKLEISHVATTDKIPYNLSLEERKALGELKSNTDLVINKADKGSTIVVQNRTDYINDALEHLNDPNTYRELDGDPTNSICRGINEILHKLHSEGLLTKEMVDFCSPPTKARLARLYFLKKLHKSPMGIRPIVSSCESPTENISQFIDYWLQPIMKGIPSYLKDTTELLNQLNELTIPKDVLLVTIDVKSLYTCIPHKEVEVSDCDILTSHDSRIMTCHDCENYHDCHNSRLLVQISKLLYIKLHVTTLFHW